MLSLLNLLSRKNGTSTIAYVDIATWAQGSSFDPTALENAVNSVLNTVVSDGRIGDYRAEVVNIEIPVLGIYQPCIKTATLYCKFSCTFPMMIGYDL